MDTSDTTIHALLARLTQLHDHRTLCEQQYAAAKQLAIPPEVQAALQAVDEACLPQLTELAEAIRQAEDDVKAAVLRAGHSVKTEAYHVIVSKGRISWSDDFLQGFAAAHPEILQGRIEREPTVSLRTLR